MGKLLLKKKSEIDQAKAKDRQIEIEEGMKLAKRVDTLRATVSTEESALQKFRSETLRVIQSEIDAKVVERDTLDTEVVILREERIRLSAPIDLQDAWDTVRVDKLYIETWKEDLAANEIKLIARESDVTALQEVIEKRENSLTQKEVLIAQATTKIQQQLTESEETLTQARQEAASLADTVSKREHQVTVREKVIATAETSLVTRETANRTHETDLANRELALKDKYETLAKAQRFINRKK